MTAWNHDMDAAPRDGSELYGLVDGQRIRIAWGILGECWLWVNPLARGCSSLLGRTPTAWMPLPDPPKESEPTNPGALP